MINKKVIFLIIFLCCTLYIIPTKAHDIDSGDLVEKIEMTIEVKESGNAIISEKWTVHSFR